MVSVPANPRFRDALRMSTRRGRGWSTAHNIQRSKGLGPNQVKTFKGSGNPRYAIKVGEVAGLLLDPPDHSIIFWAEAETDSDEARTCRDQDT